MICRLIEALNNRVPLSGFYTVEVRDGNNVRIGFDIVTIPQGLRGVLARRSGLPSSFPRTGPYRINLASFEELALPTLRIEHSDGLLIVDEIGKMELYSPAFRAAIEGLLRNPNSKLLGTTNLPNRVPFCDQISANTETVEIYQISRETRDMKYEEILGRIQELLATAFHVHHVSPSVNFEPPYLPLEPAKEPTPKRAISFSRRERAPDSKSPLRAKPSFVEVMRVSATPSIVSDTLHTTSIGAGHASDVSMLNTRLVQSSSIVILPPPEHWEAFLAIKRKHMDPKIRRPAYPHVTLMAPFLPHAYFSAASTHGAAHCRHIPPFQLTFATLKLFHNQKGVTLYVDAIDEPPGCLQSVVNALATAFPMHVRRGEFKAHIGLGLFANATEAEAARAQYQQRWRPVSFRVQSLTLMHRESEESPFEGKGFIPLGLATVSTTDAAGNSDGPPHSVSISEAPKGMKEKGQPQAKSAVAPHSQGSTRLPQPQNPASMPTPPTSSHADLTQKMKLNEKRVFQDQSEALEDPILLAWAVRDAKGSVCDLVDIGANLKPAPTLARLFRRCRLTGVTRVLITGTSVSSSRRALELVRRAGTSVNAQLSGTSSDSQANFPLKPVQLYFTAGVHPHDARTCDSNTLRDLRALLQAPECVAVGECGLDYDRMFSPRHVQLEWFAQQVQLAVESNRPLFLHERDRGEAKGGPLGSHTDLLEVSSSSIVV